MDRREAIQVLETIKDIYPRYDISKKKAQMLIPELIQMDGNGVMEKLSAHVASHHYPPTIAQIAAYPVESNHHLDKIKKWRMDAAQVTTEIKQRFHKQMTQLVKDKANDSHSQL